MKVVNVWKGRAFLHEEYTMFGMDCEKDTPLGLKGNDYEKLDELHEQGVPFVFLNDDFSEERIEKEQ